MSVSMFRRDPRATGQDLCGPGIGNGIDAQKPSPASLTVRLIPSRATEPLGDDLAGILPGKVHGYAQGLARGRDLRDRGRDNRHGR